MAIRREDLRQDLDKTDGQTLEDFERKIDKYLRQNYQGGVITYKIERGSPPDHLIPELMQRYKDTGWDRVEKMSDQEKGSWIEFE